MTAVNYARIKEDLRVFSHYLGKGTRAAIDCSQRNFLLSDFRQRSEHYLKYMAIATIEERCPGSEPASVNWRKALELKPAYLRERQAILGSPSLDSLPAGSQK